MECWNRSRDRTRYSTHCTEPEPEQSDARGPRTVYTSGASGHRLIFAARTAGAFVRTYSRYAGTVHTGAGKRLTSLLDVDHRSRSRSHASPGTWSRDRSIQAAGARAVRIYLADAATVHVSILERNDVDESGLLVLRVTGMKINELCIFFLSPETCLS